MKKTFARTLVATGVLISALSVHANDFKNESDKISYIVGTQMGKQVAVGMEQSSNFGVELNKEYLLSGIKDTIEGNVSVTEDEIRTTLTKLSQEIAEKRMKLETENAEKVLKEGTSYLEKNKAKKGVKVTDSGLQYEVLKEGKGEKPKATDKVTVHYKGTLTNGKEFDSSYARNKPTSFSLNQVIKGWTEGVQLMTVGSKYRFTIPSKLAYGSRQMGTIPANSVLVFDVELISIDK